MNPVVVIGIGGTGSHLVEPLARYLATMAEAPELILVDGDAYSAANRDRQRTGPGETGLNKAAVHSRRLLALLPELHVRAVEQFLSERNAAEIVPEGSLVLACPDSHAVRLLVSRRCQRLRNVAAVFAGNERTDGAVQVFVRRNSRNLHRPPEEYHTEMLSPSSRNPADLSCEELAARPGGGQLVSANLTAASLVVNAAFRLLEGEIPSYEEVYFDCARNRIRTRERR